MAAARAWSVMPFGIDGVLVEAEADVGTGRPRTEFLDRLASTETKDRIRAAVRNSELAWPAGLVTLALSPAVPSTGVPGCDLALACAALAAGGVVPAERLEQTVLLGELALDGRVRPVRGVLPALLAAHRAGLRRAVVPSSTVPEASLAPGIEVRGAERLSDVVAWLRGEDDDLLSPDPQTTAPEPEVADLVDVLGQPEAVWAVEVAAAGGHHLLFVGVPGTGKTMLARRLPGLLPQLSGQQALEVTAIHSMAGILPSDFPLITRPPFVAPHHSTSVPALVGGGVGLAKPGAISRAHHGVLFIDEACEFGPHRLESLRTALEQGEIRLARRDGIARYPARFQLVLATNPCPCAPPREADCSCSPHARRRYVARLSGPLLDRIDLRVRLRPVPTVGDLGAHRPEGTPAVRARVQQARERAAQRWAAHGVLTNAEVPTKVLLHREFRLPRVVTALLDRGLTIGAVTARGAERALRVAWTLADLAGLDQPGPDQIAVALEFRDRQPHQPQP